MSVRAVTLDYVRGITPSAICVGWSAKSSGELSCGGFTSQFFRRNLRGPYFRGNYSEELVPKVKFRGGGVPVDRVLVLPVTRVAIFRAGAKPTVTTFRTQGRSYYPGPYNPTRDSQHNGS